MQLLWYVAPGAQLGGATTRQPGMPSDNQAARSSGIRAPMICGTEHSRGFENQAG
jgi:hypothetical protein